MKRPISPALRDYMAAIGRAGGQVKSQAKKDAAKLRARVQSQKRIVRKMPTAQSDDRLLETRPESPSIDVP